MDSRDGWVDLGVENPVYPEEHVSSRVEYLLERKRRGRFLYANFPSIRAVGERPYKETKTLRPILGDDIHLAAAALQTYSALYLSPIFAHEFYRLGKIIGYASVAGFAKTFNVGPLLSVIQKSRSPEVLSKSKLVDFQDRGWRHCGGGRIAGFSASDDLKKLTYILEENSCCVLDSLGGKVENPCNTIELGVLCGQAEALFGGVWDGVERKCRGKGDHACEMELSLHDSTIENQGPSPLKREEYESILDRVVGFTTKIEREPLRPGIGDRVNLSLPQTINYLLLSTSKGHVVMSKWAGKKVGEKIIRAAEINDLFSALDYMKSLFYDLGIGILSYEASSDALRIQLEESMFSSGVENIKSKLCIFIAGLLEGGVSEATRSPDSSDEGDWLVKETMCTARGDPFCEFICEHRVPTTLRGLVLGVK